MASHSLEVTEGQGSSFVSFSTQEKSLEWFSFHCHTGLRSKEALEALGGIPLPSYH